MLVKLVWKLAAGKGKGKRKQQKTLPTRVQGVTAHKNGFQASVSNQYLGHFASIHAAKQALKRKREEVELAAGKRQEHIQRFRFCMKAFTDKDRVTSTSTKYLY